MICTFIKLFPFVGEVRDNFYLKEEFRTIGWITVVVIVIWIATRFIDGGELGPSNYPWVDLSGTLIPTVTKLVMMFVSSAVPIWKTFTTKQNVKLCVDIQFLVCSKFIISFWCVLSI